MKLHGSPSRIVVVVKVAAILVFVLLTNRHVDLGARVDQLNNNYGGHAVWIFGALWMVCLAGILATGLLGRFWLRVVFALPCLAGALVGSAFADIAGDEITYDNALVMRKWISFTGPTLSFYASFVTSAALLTLLGAAALLAPTDWPIRLAHRRTRRCTLLLAAAAAAPLTLILAVIVARGGYGTRGLPVQHTVPSLFLMVEINNKLAPDIERNPVDLVPRNEPLPPHVVLVIDESVRGDYLDLNVTRGLTPALLHQDAIANFGHAVSAANCSAASNLLLRTGAMPPDVLNGVYTNPYIWDYARRARMNTVYIKEQVGPARLSNSLSPQEQNHINEVLSSEGKSPLARDLHAVSLVRDLLTRPKPQFILLVKSGVHFPYERAYPAEHARFRPYLGVGNRISISNKILLENSYKNAIAWNIDQWFEALFEVPFDETVLLYTSDHGQNLFDNGRAMTHCSTSPSPFEGLVPMLAITRHPEWADQFQHAAARNVNRTSHFNLFATLLVLFGYDRDQVAAHHEPSLLDAITTSYGFTSGMITPSPRLVVGPRRQQAPLHRIPRAILDGGTRQGDGEDLF